jgi:pSer/pThr/pTyr-binding forkhead associated (FHA) protein
MINVRVCVVCKNENASTASTCSQCGSPLRISDTVSISGRLTREAIQQLRDSEVTLESGTIALYLAGKQTPLIVPAQDGVILGRNIGNSDSAIIDLTQYSAGLLGVSRQHAIIRPYGNSYCIEDLDSANGTWVNNLLLNPNHPQPLEDNDAIRLGELILHVRLTSS